MRPLALIALLGVVSDATCPVGWTYGSNSGKCYGLSDSFHTYDKCQTEFCGPNGGTLVCIENANQQAEIEEILSHHDATWFGYTGARADYSWEWTNGCTSSYKNWAENQPDDYCIDEDCGAFLPETGNFKWHDSACGCEARCLCEADSNVTRVYEDIHWDGHSCSYDTCSGYWIIWVLFFIIMWSVLCAVSCSFGIIACMSASKLGTGQAPCCNCDPGCLFCTNVVMTVLNFLVFIMFIIFAAAWGHADWFGLISYSFLCGMCGLAAFLLHSKKGVWNTNPQMQPPPLGQPISGQAIPGQPIVGQPVMMSAPVIMGTNAAQAQQMQGIEMVQPQNAMPIKEL